MSVKVPTSPRALLAGAVLVVLAYVAAGWLFLLGPARAESTRLADDLRAAEVRLVEAQAAVSRGRGTGVSVSDVLRLERAMPAGGDQVGLVLELATLARRSDVLLRSVAPAEPAVLESGATAVPVTVSVQGSFYEITRFLRTVRSLVGLDGDRIRATGRLFGVDEIELAESTVKGFPTLDATITLHAFTYSGPIVPVGEESETQEELQPTGAAAGAGGSS